MSALNHNIEAPINCSVYSLRVIELDGDGGQVGDQIAGCLCTNPRLSAKAKRQLRDITPKP